jgi:hypothetical protein
MKGPVYRFRASGNAARSRYGVNEDRLVAFVAIVGALQDAGWDRFVRGVAQMEEADLVRPWHAARTRAEAAVDDAARGGWWTAAIEDVMHAGGRGLMQAAGRQNQALLAQAPMSGGLAVLKDSDDLSRILMTVAGALTVWDLLSATDRTLIYLPIGAAIPTATLDAWTERAGERRRSGMQPSDEASSG